MKILILALKRDATNLIKYSGHENLEDNFDM